MQHPQTARALKVLEVLMSKGVFKTQKEMCRAINIDYTNFSSIKSGKRNLSQEDIDSLILVCGANPNYIKADVLPMFLKEITSIEAEGIDFKRRDVKTVPDKAIEQIIEAFRLKIEVLERDYKDLQKDHFVLRGEVKALTEMIKSKIATTKTK